jgi:hypothetical protein
LNFAIAAPRTHALKSRQSEIYWQYSQYQGGKGPVDLFQNYAGQISDLSGDPVAKPGVRVKVCTAKQWRLFSALRERYAKLYCFAPYHGT